MDFYETIAGAAGLIFVVLFAASVGVIITDTIREHL